MLKTWSKKRVSPQDLALLALLLALQIVLSRFLSISAPSVKIGFSFIPVMLAARRYGAVGAAAVAGLGDFLGAILLPTGPYHPGFTLSAALGAVIWGLLLYRSTAWWSLTAAVVSQKLLCSLGLNTLWLTQILGKGYFVLLPGRVLQAVVMTVVEILLGALLLRNPTVDRLLQKRF